MKTTRMHTICDAKDWPGPCLTNGQRLDSEARTRRATGESPTAPAHMSPRGPFIFSVAPIDGAAYQVGVTMSLYRSVATAVGTREALDLAQRLAVWHDAMVMHRRRAGDDAGPSCDLDCPHEQAESLWLEAVEVYGDRAREFAFLFSFGGASSRQQNVRPSELRA
jgi:hypothetical protein